MAADGRTDSAPYAWNVGEPSCSPSARAYSPGRAHKTVRPTPGLWGEPSCSPLSRGRMAADGRTRQCALRPECGANRRVRPSARAQPRTGAQDSAPYARNVGRTVVFALCASVQPRTGAQQCALARNVGQPSCLAPLRAGGRPRTGAQDSAPHARIVSIPVVFAPCASVQPRMGALDSAPYARIVGRTVVFAPLRAGVWPRMGAQTVRPTPGLWGEPSCSPLCASVQPGRAHKTVRPTPGMWANRRVRPSARAYSPGRRTRQCAHARIVGRTSP